MKCWRSVRKTNKSKELCDSLTDDRNKRMNTGFITLLNFNTFVGIKKNLEGEGAKRVFGFGSVISKERMRDLRR